MGFGPWTVVGHSWGGAEVTVKDLGSTHTSGGGGFFRRYIPPFLSIQHRRNLKERPSGVCVMKEEDLAKGGVTFF